MLTRPEEIFFANFVSCVLVIFAFDCAFLLFLTCSRLLILQSFKMDSGEESEVEVSSHDGEGEFNIFEEMLYRIVQNVAFVWPPFC